MIGTAAAILTAAALSAGASVISSNHATNVASTASQNATDANTTLQQQALATQQANTATARANGDAASNALATRLGLTPANAGSTAGTGAAGAGGIAGPQYDIAAFENANPDLVQEATRVTADGEFPSKEAYYQWHDQNFPQEGRNLQQYAVAPAPTSTTPATDPATPSTPISPTSTANLDSTGTYTAPRPTVGPAPTYTAPTYQQTSVAPLDVSVGSYQQSPDYNFQLDQGNRNILANASATGGLESGAALKALQTFGQNLALGDYTQWRNYATGQYNNDRSYTANRDDAANAFNTTQANNTFNAANGTYQYGTTLDQNTYNSNRDYLTGQYNTGTNALLSLAGYGQNATGQSNNALSANATNLSNGYFTNATNQGNAALAGAGQTNSLLSNSSNALAYYYGNSGAGASNALAPLPPSGFPTVAGVNYG